MSIFISAKDAATLCVQLFLDQNNPEFMYIGYAEAV